MEHLVSDLPFSPFDKALRDVLRTDFLSRVTDWLAGRDPDTVLVQAGNSAWEAAMTIEFFAQVKDVLATDEAGVQRKATLENKTRNVVRWLLTQQRIMPGGPYTSWEGVTWDTSVIIRGILTAADLLYPSDRTAVYEAAVTGCNWLLSRFHRWREEVKYPFGPADVAQILMTILFIAQRFPSLYSHIASVYEPQTPPDALSLCRYIADHLLHDCTRETTSSGSDKAQVTIAYWLDGFNTAEVVEALGMYYHMLLIQTPLLALDEEARLSHQAHLEELRTTFASAYQWFEHVQAEDGTWGAAFDTTRILQAYINLPHLTYGLVDAMPYRVFKTLRWTCDEKQIFSDGSYQHATFLTIFYASALISVYSHWPLIDREIDELYDDVLWAAPMRSAPERNQRLALEVTAVQLKEHIDELKRRNEDARERWLVAEVEMIKVRLIFVATIVFFVIAWVAASDLQLLKTQIGLPSAEEGNFLQFIGVVVALYAGVCGLIWRYRPKRRAAERTSTKVIQTAGKMSVDK